MKRIFIMKIVFNLTRKPAVEAALLESSQCRKPTVEAALLPVQRQPRAATTPSVQRPPVTHGPSLTNNLALPTVVILTSGQSNLT